MSESSELVRLSYAEIAALSNAAVSSCYVAKVVGYRKERNAYWGSWSIETPPDAYGLTREQVKVAVERQRVQGTHFRMIEIPALVMANPEVEVVVADRSSVPFARQHLSDIAGIGLKDLVTCLTRHNHWAAVLRTDDFVLLPKLPFLRYESAPQGPGLPLAWSAAHAQLDLTAIYAALQHICIRANGAAV